ncbi:endo-1,3;1,4-beta-D-glucanase-like [Pistacia vera]|uniref:endo-1,3;1,4-beta-D-glucanase-like n=1 Tax=Pistacia vera TaxID=55513 RepID=UPI001262AFC0|nr:endo-1,3;1,4-beta-D-glucanase-like [Pistacia vera]
MAGPQCCANPPNLNPGVGVGLVQKLGGLNTYVTDSTHSKLAVLLVFDIFGYEALNLRKLADKIAVAGFYVAVPDFFYGDPYVVNPERPLQAWIKDHGTDKGFDDAKPVIQDLKSKGLSAIGAVRLFFSAKVVVQLAKCEFIQAAVMSHPSFVTPDDINWVEVPIAILGAEIDQFSPPSLVKQFEEILTAKSEVDGFVKIFPKVSHGWTVRYDVEAVKCADEAHQNMLDWSAKHVK